MDDPPTLILVVSEQPTKLKETLDYLRQNGYKIYLADGQARPFQSGSMGPALILIDVLASDEDLAQYRPWRVASDLPFLFLLPDPVATRQRGAVFELQAEYVSKPPYLPELRARLETQLSRANLRRASETDRLRLDLEQEQARRTQAEAVLQQIKAQLERQVWRRTAELRDTNEQLNLRIDELSTLYFVAQTIATVANLSTALNVVVRTTAKLLDACCAGVLLLNSDSTALDIAACFQPTAPDRLRGPEANSPPALRLSQQPALQEALAGTQTTELTGAQMESLVTSLDSVPCVIRGQAMILVPLLVQGQAIGLMIVVSADADRRFSSDQVSLAETVAGQIAGTVHTARLFEALQESEQRYRAVVQDQTDLICRFKPEGEITFVNAAFCRYFEQAPEAVLGQPSLAFIFEKSEEAADYYAATAKGVEQFDPIERKIITDDQIRWLQWHVRAIIDQKNKITEYQAVGRDITERKALEEQLRQSQKMEAVGQLAGGVAHHFNNMLTAMIGYLELSLEELPPDHSVARDLREVRRVGRRAADLTQQLLAFTRNQAVRPELIDLNDLVLGLKSMLVQVLDETIELSAQLDPELDVVEMDARQFEQLLINLALNARDAMPRGGKLRIGTQNKRLNPAAATRLGGLKPGNYVQLIVTDTGQGMTEEVKSHVFEPFFTTKEVGSGTGLGLSICFGIVEQNKGYIDVESQPRQGTTVTVYLPSFQSGQGAKGQKSLSQIWPSGDETILLVEDDTSLRTLTAQVLSRQGYTILQAKNGQEALDLVQSQPETPIHLLLTDVVMPKIGGKTLAARLKKEYPALKLLFISGYSEDRPSVQEISLIQKSFLAKPFNPSTLTEKVRAVLDTPPSAD